MSFIRSSSLLGIDVRQNLLRLVELSCHGSRYRVEACVSTELVKSEASEETILAAIKNILKQVTPKTRNVAIALSHTLVVFKEFQVAAGLSAKEIRRFLDFNLNEQPGEVTEKLTFDYQIAGDGAAIVNNLMTLQTVAVQHVYVERWVKILRAAKLIPKIIDVDIYALERAIRLQVGEVSGLTAVFNIDDGQALLVVLDDKKVVYVHEVPFEEGPPVSISQILGLVDAQLHLLDSVLLQPLARIVLSGEQATLSGLMEEVSAKFNLQVIRANPFLGMELATGLSQEDIYRVLPLMLFSCGLALRVRDNHED